MTKRIHATYLFDPLCGWCYGAAPMLERLGADGDLSIEVLPTGLFAGEGARSMDSDFAAFAWSNDERIARLTGQTFSEAYRRHVLGKFGTRFDSGPATLALAAVALTAPDRQLEALRAIQAARFVDARDITDFAALGEILRALSLLEAAERLQKPDDALVVAGKFHIQKGQTAMRSFGVTGVPRLIAGIGETRRPVPGAALFGDAEAMIALLKAA